MLLALSIFIITMILVIWQPKGLGIGYSASLGAIFALATGTIALSDIWIVWGIIWNAVLTFIAIIVISIILDRGNFFQWAALHITRLGAGVGLRLFFLMMLLGALISAFFANDGAALILTPIVIAILVKSGVSRASMLAFVMGAGFIADTASLPFTVSNLVNIVSADYYEISFGRYASVMMPVNIVSILMTLLVLGLFYRREIKFQYQVSRDELLPSSVIEDKKLFWAGWITLLLLLIGFFISDYYKIPLSIIAGAVAIFLLYVAGKRGVIAPKSVLLLAPWQIVIFSLGMYLVVFGLRNAGLMNYLIALLNQLAEGGLWSATIGTGVLSALLSSVMNNLPTVLIGVLSIDSSTAVGVTKEAMIYANVIGSDLGPKITPIGSLATLLWLHVLSQNNLRITWGYYFRVGVILTLPVLIVTLSALVIRLTW